MNKELSEILTGFKRALVLLAPQEKLSLFIASILMAIAGILTNLPALILGRLTDTLTKLDHIQFSLAFPYIGLVIILILIRESLTVIRKYLIEM